MSDVFLSYAREDLAYVRKLKGALEERGLDLWVDLEGLYAGEEFKPRILAAIEGADAFVFVISPASAASGFCHEEVAYAAAQSKRIIPVLVEEAGESSVPEAAASRQWIFARAEDDFDQAMESVASALETDPKHVRAHTRLLVRSREWKRANGDVSLMLRGTDLEKAESWLTEASRKEEQRPVPVQIEYIAASRRRESKRHRILLGGVSFGLAVALILAAVALFQRQEKEKQRVQAVSRELAANSVAQLEIDPELSLLLAKEALAVATTLQAEDSLRQALLRSHLHRTFSEHTKALTGAEFSSDGTRLLTAAHDGRTLIHDADGGGRPLEVSGYRATFSPDGRIAATVAEDKVVLIWDAISGERLAELPGHDAHINDLAFSTNGDLLATGDRDGKTLVWSVPGGKRVLGPLRHTGFVTELDFSPSGGLLAVAGFYSKTRVWEISSGNMLLELDGYRVAFHPQGGWMVTGGVTGTLNYWNTKLQDETIRVEAHAGPISSVSFSADGQTILSTSKDKTAKTWTLADRQPANVLIGHTSWVEAGALSPDGQYALTAGVDRVARLWQLSTGLVVAELRGHRGQVTGVSFHPDGERMLTVADDAVVRVWKIAMGVPRLALAGHKYTVGTLAVSPDGALLATGSEDATARIWDISTGLPVGPALTHEEEVTGLAFLPDGSSLFSADIAGHIASWDTATWQIIKTQDLGLELYDLAVSPDGSLLLAGSNEGTHLFRLPGWEPERAVVEYEELVVDVAFSPDGRLFATASFDKTARLWATSTHEPVGAPLEHEGFVTSVDFNADGTRLLTASGDVATIWDVATGVVLDQFRGHVNELYTAVYSPNGDYILTSSQDYTTRLWDVESGRTVLQLRGQTDAVYSAIFGSDGRWIATGSEDATTHVYDCDVCRQLDEMREAAAERLTRELTAEERRRYMGSEPDG